MYITYKNPKLSLAASLMRLKSQGGIKEKPILLRHLVRPGYQEFFSLHSDFKISPMPQPGAVKVISCGLRNIRHDYLPEFSAVINYPRSKILTGISGS